MRSGTLPAPLAVGLGYACQLAQEEMEFDHEHISALSTRLIDGIQSQLTDVHYNGDADGGYPGCVNLSFAFVEGESLLMALKDIALSSGSACTSASLEPSYVLRGPSGRQRTWRTPRFASAWAGLRQRKKWTTRWRRWCTTPKSCER